MRSIRSIHTIIGLAVLMGTSAQLRADIYRWDDNQLIPGTSGITPGPGINLSNWNSPGHQLQFANFDAVNLAGATFAGSDLTNAVFNSSDLTGANFANANLAGTALSAILINANFTGAIIDHAFPVGISFAQVASTRSYQQFDLTGIRLSLGDLSGWNLSGQNLTDAFLDRINLVSATVANANLTDSYLGYATLTNANFTGAVIKGATFNFSSGLTFSQIASTLSFQQHDLSGVHLSGVEVSGWNFSGQDLSHAEFGVYSLENANFTGAHIQGALFRNGTTALTFAQLASTTSYQQHDLSGLGLFFINATAWDFSNQCLRKAFLENTNLTNATFLNANLTTADFAGANLKNTNFTNADLRSAIGFSPVATTITTNAIMPNGTITNLMLTTGTTRTIQYSPLAVKVLSSLTIATSSPGAFSATLDLTDNKLILQSTSPTDKQSKLPTLIAALKSGANNGAWSGKGITSTAADQDLTHYAVALFDNATLNLTTFGNQQVDANSLLLTIAHSGDANNNAIIDIQDLTIIANNWQKPSISWSTGDLNLDGITDIQDLTIIANNWQQTSSFSLAASPSLPLAASPPNPSQFPITDYQLPPTPVPEPTSLLLLSLPLLALHRPKRPLRHSHIEH